MKTCKNIPIHVLKSFNSIPNLKYFPKWGNCCSPMIPLHWVEVQTLWSQHCFFPLQIYDLISPLLQPVGHFQLEVWQFVPNQYRINIGKYQGRSWNINTSTHFRNLISQSIGSSLYNTHCSRWKEKCRVCWEYVTTLPYAKPFHSTT